MNPMSPHDPDKLESAIHRVLRSLPDRRAPAGMEARILAELSRRAALPWWHKSFAHWPGAIRATFFIGSALAAALLVSGLIVLGRSSGAIQLEAGVAEPFAWLRMARETVASLNSSVRMVIEAIPAAWLYGALAAFALSYATLAAIGTATYRVLSTGRKTP